MLRDGEKSMIKKEYFVLLVYTSLSSRVNNGSEDDLHPKYMQTFLLVSSSYNTSRGLSHCWEKSLETRIHMLGMLTLLCFHLLETLRFSFH